MDRLLAPGSSRPHGYLGLLILVAILSVTSAAFQTAGAIAQRINNERELLRVGRDLQRAFARYYEATPRDQRPYPATLADLLEDPRYPTLRRDLRRIPIDPMTGTRECGLVWTANHSGSVAVYSQAGGKPIQLTGFPLEWRHFAGKPPYRDWKFGLDGANPIVTTDRDFMDTRTP
jgi:type II secretory pathway pseudopilin PulG